MKLKGIELNGTYKIEFKNDWFEVYVKKGSVIYAEDNRGYWSKWGYDKKDNPIYFESSNGDWSKWEYDSNGNLIYYENNYGEIVDKRIKELTIEEIEKLLGYKIKIKGEKRGESNGH